MSNSSFGIQTRMSQEPPILPYESPIDKHLRVDHISRELKHRSARGHVVMILSYAIQLALGVGGMAVLARLLEPRDFGYMAMVITVVNFVLIFREFLITPVIHSETLTHEHASGLFWMNFLTSIIVGAAVAASAPVLSWFYGESKVLGIALALSVGVTLSMVGMLHVGLLRRQMRFGAIMLIEVGAMAAGMIVGILSAVAGAGYWALVFQQMAMWIWQSGSAWWLCGWRPASRKSSVFLRDASMRHMFRFGQHSTMSRMLTYTARNFDTILVGYFTNARMVGLYQKSNQWAMLPVWQIHLPMGPVAVSSFSRLQNDPQRYRSYVRTTLLGVFALTLPAIALTLVEADHIIRLLMGEKWLEAIPMLRILSVSAYFSSFLLVTGWLYVSEGRTRDQLRWSTFFAPTMIISVIAGSRWGALGIASGFAISQSALAFPGLWYCLRRSPFTWSDFWGSAWRASVASAMAALALWLVRFRMPEMPNVFASLAVNCAIFGVVYLILWIMLPGGRADTWAFVRQIRELRQGTPIAPAADAA